MLEITRVTKSGLFFSKAAKTVDWEVHERKSRFVSTLNDDGNTMDAKDSKSISRLVNTTNDHLKSSQALFVQSITQ